MADCLSNGEAAFRVCVGDFGPGGGTVVVYGIRGFQCPSMPTSYFNGVATRSNCVGLPPRRASNDWQAPKTLSVFMSMRSRIIRVAWK
ncbi:hypothetical protein TNCV_2743171 [Trichonephila clavipes]|nr:hypothetical protein TNCV_2743171 [Trichonephila clavipes]